MLGSGSHFGRARGEDRFYIPVKARKNRNQKQKQQKQKQEAVEREEKNNNDTSSLSPSQKSKTVVLDNRKISKELSLLSSVSDSETSLVSQSNLQRFLESTTPLVPAQYFSKVIYGHLLRNGAPLVLDGRDCVVEYYVPYLSVIQLYVESLQSDARLRPKKGSNGIYYKDSNSDGSSGYEIEEGIKFSRENHHYHSLRNEIPFRMKRLSISDESNATQEGFSSDDSKAWSSRHCLVFEFLDQDSPYCRVPLADKISDLACCHSRLKTLRSCDLLPISWISVAWYPIYRIPTGQTLKDLDACFVTYHSLSTPIEGNGSNHSPILVYPNEQDGIPKISLPAFGLASYKFKGFMWPANSVSEHQLTNSLTRAAENWLRLLQVIHPDFQFFALH